MIENRQSLEKLGRFLLRGLRIGASTVSIVELLRNDWTGGISAGVAWLVFLQVERRFRPSARIPRTDPQLGVAGGWIEFPPKLKLRQQADHQLRGGAHQ